MQNKLEELRFLLRDCPRTLVAYSGGVDSVFLAKVAHESWKHFLDLAYWNVELGEDVE